MATPSQIHIDRREFDELKSVVVKLTEVVESLARVEERQTSANEAMARAFRAIEKNAERIGVLEHGKTSNERTDRIEDRLRSVELMQPGQNKTSQWVDRGITGLVSGAGGALLAVIVWLANRP